MEKDNVIVDKSKVFALRIIKMYKYLCDEKKEFVLSKQVLRSGTSIGWSYFMKATIYQKNNIKLFIQIVKN